MGDTIPGAPNQHHSSDPRLQVGNAFIWGLPSYTQAVGPGNQVHVLRGLYQIHLLSTWASCRVLARVLLPYHKLHTLDSLAKSCTTLQLPEDINPGIRNFGHGLQIGHVRNLQSCTRIQLGHTRPSRRKKNTLIYPLRICLFSFRPVLCVRGFCRAGKLCHTRADRDDDFTKGSSAYWLAN